MGRAVFPPCYLTRGQTMVGVMKIMAASFKRFHACTAALSAPELAAGHCRPMPPPGDSWTLTSESWSVSCGVTALFSWVLVHKGFVCAFQESVSPVLCKFWWLYGGANSDPLQEGLCHTQVCCTQSPCPCSRPLLICTLQETLKHRN